MAMNFAREMEIKQMNYAQASQLSTEEFAFWAENRSQQNDWDHITEYEERTCVPQEY